MGTWSLPQTKTQAEKLVKLMKDPLSAKNAIDELDDLYGNDKLFDELQFCQDNFDEDYDVRDIVYSYINELLHRYNEIPSDFVEPFETEALELLKPFQK